MRTRLNSLNYFNDIADIYSLSSNNITRVFQDRSGIMWIGNFLGINRWNTATSNFTHFRVKQSQDFSLSNNQVNAIAQTEPQHMWFGTFGGLNKVDLGTGQVEVFAADKQNAQTVSDNRVMSLHASDENTLWIGTRANGFSKLDTRNNQFTHYRHDAENNNSVSANGITAIAAADKGKLWISTFGGGLNLFDPQSEVFTHFKHEQDATRGLSSNKILSMTKSADGLLWLGTWDKGVNVFNPLTGSIMQIQHSPSSSQSLSNNLVWAIHEDQKNNIWFGTSGGLNLLKAEDRFQGRFTLQHITRKDGLPSDVIYGILEDNIGNIWVSTNRGIAKIDLFDFSLSKYDVVDGLQGNEFNSGAFFKAEDGRLYFGGTNGASAFSPSEIEQNNFIPPVVITKFVRLQQEMPLSAARGEGGAISLGHKDYLIAFEFAGLDFTAPANNRYEYMLEGFDSEWIKASDIRRATYTNLPAGDYLFKVKASNSDGVWNKTPIEIPVTVSPAPWLSMWAYAGYASLLLVSIAVIALFIRSRNRKDAQYRAKLEEEVRLRTRELQMANDRLLSASVTDQLTGLHNRRYMNSIVEKECASLNRELRKFLKKHPDAHNTPRLFCLMFDLDGFKPINDTYGHNAGDKIIRQISELLRTLCRTSDTVVRWGGDEFLVMGRIEDIAEVKILAERIRSEIVCTAFDIGIRQKVHLSCSIGYALYPFSMKFPDFLSWEQVQVIADSALYHAKGAGKNACAGIVSTEKQPSVSFMNTLISGPRPSGGARLCANP